MSELCQIRTSLRETRRQSRLITEKEIITTDKFEELLQNRIEKIKTVLGKKADEYAQNGDRLFNFRQAARINGIPMTESLWGMGTKHLVSVQDLIYGRLENTKEMADEKIGDMINYLILLEAVLTENRFY